MNRWAALAVAALVLPALAGCTTLGGFEQALEAAGVARFQDAPTPDAPGRLVAITADGTRTGHGAVVGRDLVLTVDHVVGRSQSVWVRTLRTTGWVEARVVSRISTRREGLVLLQLETDSGFLAATIGFPGFEREDIFPTCPGGTPARALTEEGLEPWGPGALEPGDSGSPVLDASGRLVGLVSGRIGGSLPVYAPLPGLPALDAPLLARAGL